MKTVILVLWLACLTTAALADDLVVVKDTREYLRYTQTVRQDGACAMAKDPDHPAKGDCEEQRAKAIVGGEYIVRKGDLCMRQSYELDKAASFVLEGRLVPSVALKEWDYRCDSQGKPV